ncbi:unnamed protein product [Durusdinium trenchii]|uniref:Uncharacterized protein n=2 Tax=Durusdinium trenchii TaxID=1381693 RepID=A0ABP0SRK0_9DINO
MGIKGLFPYLVEAAPKAYNTSELKRYTGRRLAVDASGWMYQFLSIVRTGAAAENLQNNQGAATSHLQGFVFRALKLLEAGVHPVFIFDGKPPEMKTAVNRARRKTREHAAEEHAEAVATGASSETVYKAASRSTVVTKEHSEHTKELLRAMGLPVVEAPGEAEATCAQLCKEGHVYAAVTEDMDVLTFGSPRQIKNLFDVEGSRARQPKPAHEIDLERVLQCLSYTQDQFIEFSILCGCDYLPHLPRMGPKTAAQLLKREGSLKAVVRAVQAGKGPKGCLLPDEWDWEAAKRIFQQGPKELGSCEPNCAEEAPNFDRMRSLLVEKHQFNSSRVENMLDRLRKARSPGGAASSRGIESFFQAPKRPRLSPPAPPAILASSDPVVIDDESQGLEILEPTWKCPKCTFANDVQRSSCEMCEHPQEAKAWPLKTAVQPIDLDD